METTVAQTASVTFLGRQILFLGSSDSLDDKVRPRSGFWIEFTDCEKVSLWRTNGSRSQRAEQVKVQPSILDANFSGDLESQFFKMQKHIATLRRLIKDEELFIYCQILYIFLSQLILCSFIWRLQYVGFSFEVEVAYIYFSYRSSWHPFVIISAFFPSLQLFICFHRPVIFPDVVIFPVFSGVNVHLLFFSRAASKQISTHISQLFERTISFFLFHIFFSYSQQVHEPAYKQSIIPMCLQVAQEAYY